uniref:Putative secreted protein n=1 Tax=Rhipicephalus microplus TaxID=6941 RepID=A0A6G5A550_RHIMP
MNHRGCVTLRPICIIAFHCFWLERVLACTQQACLFKEASATPMSEAQSFRLKSTSSSNSCVGKGRNFEKIGVTLKKCSSTRELEWCALPMRFFAANT